MEGDKRFAKVTRDPRFKKIPRKDRKVKIDSRFEKMFTDKSFTTKYFVDKRGSQLGTTSSEDLHKFYELSDEDEEDEESSEQSNKEIKQEKRTNRKGNNNKGNEKLIKQKKNKENVKKKEEKMRINRGKGLHNEQEQHIKASDDEFTGVDYARGEGVLESSSDDDEFTGVDYARAEGVLESSSDDDELARVDYARGEGVLESSSDDDEFTGVDNAIEEGVPESSGDEEDIELVPLGKGQGQVEHNWGEMDNNAVTTDQATKRIAVCNLDWDRVTASDLLVLFNSMKPAGGVIHSVKIYPSDFGLERMKSEEQHGPEELQDSDEPAHGTNQEGEAFSQEKLRQYQINRLKYYYAVIECDSCETANHLYEECDGVEFELSANILDLRFIPEDMEFDRDPKSVCTEIPSVATYEPMNFMTTALNQSKVKITWDETDPGRLRTTMRKFDKKDLLDMDFKAYLASSSDDDNDDGSVNNQEQDSGDDDDDDDDDKRIAKYKQLLHDIEKKEEESDENAKNEMAITWEPGLQETAQQLVSRKMKEKEEVKLTPWEKYQRDRKQKRKERREKNIKDKVEKTELTGKEVKTSGLSDDEIPSDVDMSDPFFNQEFGSGFPDSQVGETNKEKAKKRRGKQPKELSEEDKRKQDELKLLMMDDEDNRQHFSLKNIIENEKKSKKKKKKKGKQDVVTADTFQINVKDPRFEALYTSHHFSLDPSDPQFRKTKALENILEEKHKRRKQDAEETTNSDREQRLQGKRKEKQVKDPSLSLLVKSIKSKTGQFHEQKKKKLKLSHS